MSINDFFTEPKLRLIRPTSNSTQTKGLVEILVEGKWSKLAFDIHHITKYTHVARALCRSLGFKGRAGIFGAFVSPSYTDIDSWIALGECTANAQSIDECKGLDIERHLVNAFGRIKFLVCENTTCKSYNIPLIYLGMECFFSSEHRSLIP